MVQALPHPAHETKPIQAVLPSKSFQVPLFHFFVVLIKIYFLKAFQTLDWKVSGQAINLYQFPFALKVELLAHHLILLYLLVLVLKLQKHHHFEYLHQATEKPQHFHPFPLRLLLCFFASLLLVKEPPPHQG